MTSGLELTLLLLGSAVLGVVAFRMLHLPPMLGYLAVGVLIGPHALHLADNGPTTHALAEFGIVFLMFSIGLEFSLAQLKAMRRIVFGLGLAQVVLTILITVAAALAARWLPGLVGISWQAALALGGALAMSSTAIVVKLLTERLELESEHGRRIIGILLFQDLAVVPLLILIPSLARPAEELAMTLAWAGIKAAGVLALLLFFGQKVMRNWFNVVAKRRSQELFMLNLLLVTLGAAYITEHAGLSMALGAFVAGMLISETQYKHQVEEDIKPFRDVLLGLFFISIGMLLNLRLVLENWWIVLLLLLAPVLLKFALIAALAKAFGSSDGTAMRTGLALAQAGEFGFVLLNLASGSRLIDPFVIQLVLASMVLSMLLAPFLIANSDKLVLKIASNEWMLQSLQLTQIASRTMATNKHVIACWSPSSPASAAAARAWPRCCRKKSCPGTRSTSIRSGCRKRARPAPACRTATPRGAKA
jgi:CPA2 family monovalent cation:H+ antiporter-2